MLNIQSETTTPAKRTARRSSLQETKSTALKAVDASVEKATQAITTYDSSIAAAFAERQEQSHAALEALYEVCSKLDDHDLRSAFLNERKIKVHGHTRNPMQPIVKFILKTATSSKSVLRREASRFAGAITEGIEQGVEIGRFTNLITSTEGGYQALAAAWSRRQRKAESTIEAKRDRIAEQAEFLGDDPEAAALGYEGDVLAIVHIIDGKVTLRRVLVSDPDQVNTVVRRHMRKAAEVDGSKSEH